MKKLLMFLCAVTLGIGMSSTASADLIFYDNFNRTDNNSLNAAGPGGWLEGETEVNDVAIRNQALRISDNNTTPYPPFASHAIDLSWYENVTFDFRWKASANTEATGPYTDIMGLAYTLDNGFTIHPIWGPQVLGGSDWANVSINIDSLSPDPLSPDFQFAFSAVLTGSNEYIDIDDLYVRGDNIHAATVPAPEPATIALLGIGLAGLAGGAARRKWKKKAFDKS